MGNETIKPNNRKSVRLSEYNYSENGAYFITICTQNKKSIFGCVKDGAMEYSEYGCIALNEIAETNNKRKDKGIQITKYVVMPNHVHLLLEIVGTRRAVSGTNFNVFSKTIPNSVSEIVGAYKSAVTKQIRRLQGGHGTQCPYEIDNTGKVWQSRFYDRIIRNEFEYQNVWNYIDTNPLKWELDKYYI